MVSMNQRLRQKLEQKGPAAAKKWAKDYEENARKFNASEHRKAQARVRSFNEARNTVEV